MRNSNYNFEMSYKPVLDSKFYKNIFLYLSVFLKGVITTIMHLHTKIELTYSILHPINDIYCHMYLCDILFIVQIFDTKE